MKLFLLNIVLFTVFSASAQTDVNSLLAKADSAYFDYKDYKSSLALYKSAKAKLKMTDKDYAYTVDKIAKSLFYYQFDESKSENYKSSIALSKELIEILDYQNQLVDTALLAKRYWLYKNIIMGYFSLGESSQAKAYQDLMYKAYLKKSLPEGLENQYCFEKFVYKGMNVWGYERYAKLGDKETEGSFSKHIYYIYSRDSNGEDNEQQYTLHTVKIHKFKGDEPDYVLTKRSSNGEQEISESIWTFTFNDPIDYGKLHQAILHYMDGGVEADAMHIINTKK